VDATLDRAEQTIFRVSQERISRDLTPLKSVLQEYYQRIGLVREEGGQITGMPSGFEDLDKILGGFQPSDLVIVAGRPGAGKSSLALTMARNIAVRFGGSVAIFSLEMSREQVAQRLLASETGIDSQRLRLVSFSDGELTRLTQTIDLLSEAPIFIDDTPIPTPLEISAKTRRLHAERSLAAVIVDYLQLMRAGERVENRVQEVSLISRRLKALARELNVPVIVCSQLSRAVETRPDKRPILSDLRESGSIEQDADVVMFIYRDEMYNENTDRPNIADIILAKHRHGPTGQIYLHFDRTQVRFRSLEIYREEEEELVF
jgi:replicative DNA helicase